MWTGIKVINMIFNIISIFPEIFECLTKYGITSKAYNNNLYVLNSINPRDFTCDHHRKVDDKSYGGGPGMVMMVEPLDLAMEHAISLSKDIKPLRIYLSPQGITVNQNIIKSLSLEKSIIFVCGRYEGVDERFIEHNIDLELSLGDFVTSGGELPAMAIMDSIIRHIPTALHDSNSAQMDSFMNGLLDYPHYTVPRVYKNKSVPDVLLSGNHKQIEHWRLKMSLWNTYKKRPDLILKRNLNKLESGLLDELIKINSK